MTFPVYGSPTMATYTLKNDLSAVARAGHRPSWRT